MRSIEQLNAEIQQARAHNVFMPDGYRCASEVMAHVRQLQNTTLPAPGSERAATMNEKAAPGAGIQYHYNPAHPCGTCSNCGEEMVHNVPRMGPAGGFVHKATGQPQCGPRQEIQFMVQAQADTTPDADGPQGPRPVCSKCGIVHSDTETHGCHCHCGGIIYLRNWPIRPAGAQVTETREDDDTARRCVGLVLKHEEAAWEPVRAEIAAYRHATVEAACAEGKTKWRQQLALTHSYIERIIPLEKTLGDLVDAVNVEFPGGMRDIGGKTGPALIAACNALAAHAKDSNQGPVSPRLHELRGLSDQLANLRAQLAAFKEEAESKLRKLEGERHEATIQLAAKTAEVERLKAALTGLLDDKVYNLRVKTVGLIVSEDALESARAALATEGTALAKETQT